MSFVCRCDVLKAKPQVFLFINVLEFLKLSRKCFLKSLNEENSWTYFHLALYNLWLSVELITSVENFKNRFFFSFKTLNKESDRKADSYNKGYSLNPLNLHLSTWGFSFLRRKKETYLPFLPLFWSISYGFNFENYFQVSKGKTEECLTFWFWVWFSFHPHSIIYNEN